MILNYPNSWLKNKNKFDRNFKLKNDPRSQMCPPLWFVDSFHGGIHIEEPFDSSTWRPPRSTLAFENEATGFRCPRVGSRRSMQSKRKGRHKGETQSFKSFSVFKVSRSWAKNLVIVLVAIPRISSLLVLLVFRSFVLSFLFFAIVFVNFEE